MGIKIIRFAAAAALWWAALLLIVTGLGIITGVWMALDFNRQSLIVEAGCGLLIGLGVDAIIVSIDLIRRK